MVCDICNAPGSGTKVSSEQIRQCAALGFNPFTECVTSLNPVAQMMGMSASNQYEGWKQQVAGDTTDWNVCHKCMSVLDQYLQPRKADVGSKATMLENVLRTRGLPCNGCQKSVPIPDSIIPESAMKMASGETCHFKCPECGGTIIISAQPDSSG